MKRLSLQRGVAIVEFALVLPLMLLLTFITTEFGRAIFQYNTLAKSVRDAGRYVSIQTPGTGMTEARNLIVYGSVATSDTPQLPGLTPEMVPDPVWATAGTGPVINTVTVRVSGYTFQSIFTSAFGQTFGPLTFPDITATMRSHL
jgi:Flp pilus assembly protein TadG